MKQSFSLSIFILFIHFISFSQNNNILLKIEVNNKYGFINQEGKVVIQPNFFAVGKPSSGLIAVREKDKYGYIDYTGKEIISPQFEFAKDFIGEYAVVYDKGIANLINKKGRKLLPNIYSDISTVKGKYIKTKGLQNNFGVCDIKGKVILDTLFADISKGRLDFFTVTTRETYKDGVFNSKGKLIFDTTKVNISTFDYNIALVSKYRNNELDINERSFAIIDTNGNFIIPFGKYKELEEVNNSKIIKALTFQIREINQKDTSYQIQLLNAKGEELIYDKKKNFIYIDNQIISINPRYRIENENNTYYKAVQVYDLIEHDNFWINNKGEKVSEPLIELSSGYFKKCKNEKCQLFDSKMNLLASDIPENAEIYKNFYIINTREFNPLSQNRYSYFKIHYFNRIKFLDSLDDFQISENEYFKVRKKSKIEYYSNSFKLIFSQNTENDNVKLKNIDYREPTKYLYPTLKFDRNDNFEEILKRPLTLSEKGTLIIETNPLKSNEYKFKFTNLSDTLFLQGVRIDGLNLNMVLQAQNESKEWIDIEDWTSYTIPTCCPTEYLNDFMLKNDSFEGYVPIYDGSISTKMRLKFMPNNSQTVFYSNEFNGKINPQQFWRLKPLDEFDIRNRASIMEF